VKFVHQINILKKNPRRLAGIFSAQEIAPANKAQFFKGYNPKAIMKLSK